MNESGNDNQDGFFMSDFGETNFKNWVKFVGDRTS